MKDTLISFETAVLAKEKGFNIPCLHLFTKRNNKIQEIGEENISHTEENVKTNYGNCFWYRRTYNNNTFLRPTQSLLQKFIREKKGVHIEIHRNASGYYWSMCKADGGTDLGWSDISGPNDSGVWDSFEGALENALQVQLSYDLPSDITIIKHWGNYVEFALKSK